MSVFSIAWKAIQIFLASKKFQEAFSIALEVIPRIEQKAKEAKAAGKPMSWKQKHQLAFDEVEEELAERGYKGSRYVFVAIEFALQHLGYFDGKGENE